MIETIASHQALAATASSGKTSASIRPEDARTFAEMMKTPATSTGLPSSSGSVLHSTMGQVMSSMDVKPSQEVQRLMAHMDPSDPILNQHVMLDLVAHAAPKAAGLMVASSVASAANSTFKSVLKSHE